MSHKQKTTNTVGWSTPPVSAATTQLQNVANQGTADYSVPIRNAYARADQQLSRSYNNPLGAYTTADVADKSLREQRMSQGQNLGMDLAQASQQGQQNRFNQQYQIAGLTAPQMYGSGGTTTTGGALDILGLGASTASGALA